MPEAPLILRVALPTPLYRCFDYLAPSGCEAHPGMRVSVPFGRQSLVGMVVATAEDSEYDLEKLKPISELLDEAPIVSDHWLTLCQWVAGYYHHPIGEVIATALPNHLSKGKAAVYQPPRFWSLTAEGKQALEENKALQRAVRQLRVMNCLTKNDGGLEEERLKAETESTASILRKLADKQWIRAENRATAPATPIEAGPRLNAAQQKAVDALKTTTGFSTSLLEGVTGSGKTEVYIQLAQAQAETGKQTLILVPEIGLTPALIERFTARLGQAPAVLHSGLNDAERLHAWQRAARGHASVVIGTRSAVFTPLASPGAIIIDEEHDASYKQQDGLRYSARDVAVRRGQMLDVPVLLGSATPSLETLANALSGRYGYHQLPGRAGKAAMPKLETIDLRRQPMIEGLSQSLLGHLDRHIADNGQVLLFLNRRGFSPSLICHDCGWVADCQRCDVELTYHRRQARLRCHHCGSDRPVPPACPDCGSHDFMPQGVGTERIEHYLQERYPNTGILRIDRDTTRRKNALPEMLDAVSRREAQILIGTQMLAKGHDFPDLTMVGMLNTDGGLFSVDFRAPERMAQLITQVSGRAGRGERAGEVFIQTHHPDHPLLLGLLREGYGHFAKQALSEREMAGYPPYGHLCLFRAESPQPGPAMAFLREVARLARQQAQTGLFVWEPVPAPMERRAGRYRCQLLLQAPNRSPLHVALNHLLQPLADLPLARKVRWSVDIDPIDML